MRASKYFVLFIAYEMNSSLLINAPVSLLKLTESKLGGGGEGGGKGGGEGGDGGEEEMGGEEMGAEEEMGGEEMGEKVEEKGAEEEKEEMGGGGGGEGGDGGGGGEGGGGHSTSALHSLTSLFECQPPKSFSYLTHSSSYHECPQNLNTFFLHLARNLTIFRCSQVSVVSPRPHKT